MLACGYMYTGPRAHENKDEVRRGVYYYYCYCLLQHFSLAIDSGSDVDGADLKCSVADRLSCPPGRSASGLPSRVCLP